MIDAAVLQAWPVRGSGLRRIWGLRFRRNAAARYLAASLTGEMAAHLVQPLGYFFSKPGQMMLRSYSVVLRLSLGKQTGRGR